MSDEETEGDLSAPEKKSKLPLILTLVGGLVLGGGGATGYFMFLAPAPEGEQVAQSEEEKAAEKLVEMKPHFVLVDRISAPLISQQDVVVGHVSMYVRLQVKDTDDLDWVRDRLPMVRHAINASLSNTGVNFPDSAHAIDYDGAAKRIAQAVRDYLKTDKVLAAHIKEAARL